VIAIEAFDAKRRRLQSNVFSRASNSGAARLVTLANNFSASPDPTQAETVSASSVETHDGVTPETILDCSELHTHAVSSRDQPAPSSSSATNFVPILNGKRQSVKSNMVVPGIFSAGSAVEAKQVHKAARTQETKSSSERSPKRKDVGAMMASVSADDAAGGLGTPNLPCPIGSTAVLHGLHSRPDLSGSMGSVISYDPLSLRYGILVDGSLEKLAVKGSCLKKSIFEQ
jgi:hypothetical protein